MMTVNEIAEAENSLFEAAEAMASVREHPGSDGPDMPPILRI